jgi:long-chain acyl-CoA synthetase
MALQQEHITCMTVVPQVLQLFMRRMEQEAQRTGRLGLWRFVHQVAPILPYWARRIAFSSVHRSLGGRFQFFLSGGAYLDPSLHRKWEHLGIRVVQGYGATEAAPVISTNSLEERKLGSVGRPIGCLELRIAPDGEIQVRGDNISQGYWQDAERTREAFADGWYLTGDIGRLDNDSYLYLHGRKKDVIVLANGLNVYPEDVENALKVSPTLKDCVVLGLPSDHGPEVHAVLLLEDREAAGEVVRAANRLLAPHQRVGSHTVWSDPDFPRTHTLKVRRSEVQARLVEMAHH